MWEVCLLGTSGMMPLPGRFLTSAMTRYNGSGLLIDCGEGTQVALRKRGFSCHDIDTILITHTHGDHVSGLPGLLLSMGNAERTEPVRIIGPKGTESVVRSLCVIAPDLPFEVNFTELSEAREEFSLGEISVSREPQYHLLRLCVVGSQTGSVPAGEGRRQQGSDGGLEPGAEGCYGGV